MARSFAITAPSNSVELDGRTTAEVTLTVTNQTERALRGTARLVAIEPTRREWLRVVDGEEERAFAPKGTHQVKVRVDVPPDTPKGTYAFRMDFVSSENPDEDSTPGPAIGVQVAAQEPAKKGFPLWIIPVAAVVLLAVGLGLFFALRGGGDGEAVAVPDLKGRTVEDATKALADAGLTSKIGEARDVPGAAPGTVVEQKPAAGEPVAKGGAVELFPQGAPAPAAENAAVPSVVGRTIDAAKVALFEAGFTPKLGPGKFTGGAPGQVVAQAPAGNAQAPRGSVVEIVPEKESVVIPNVLRRPVQDAVVALKQAKLDWEPLQESTTEAAPGTVLKQAPAAGARAEQDSVVKLTIAKEPGRNVVLELPAVLHRADLEKFHRFSVAMNKDFVSVSEVSPNPANLFTGGKVSVTASYVTQHGGTARITVTPLTNGKPTPGGSTASVLTGREGRGEVKPEVRVFTTSGVKVDTLLVELIGPDGKSLHQVKKPVALNFIGSPAIKRIGH